jgi:hypothetical protein
MREDTGLADIDRLAQQYMGGPYRQRDRRRISAWIAVDGWHGAILLGRVGSAVRWPASVTTTGAAVAARP